MIQKSDTIYLMIAQTLRTVVYSALLFLLLSLILRYLHETSSKYFAICGIGLIVIGPLTGIFAAGIFAFIGKNNKLLICSILLIFIYIIAYIVSL